MACAPLRVRLQIRREPTATKVHGLRISQLSFGKLSRKETQQRFQNLFGVTLVTWSGQETTLRSYRWKTSNKTGKIRFWFSDVAFGAWKQKWKEWCFLLVLQDTLFHPAQGFSVFVDSSWGTSVLVTLRAPLAPAELKELSVQFFREEQFYSVVQEQSCLHILWSPPNNFNLFKNRLILKTRVGPKLWLGVPTALLT